MILRGAKGDNITAIGQREKARFFARHKFFDHDRCTSIPKTATEHIVDRGLRLRPCFGDNHTFARRQAVRFDHIRRVEHI